MNEHLGWRYATKKFDPAKKIPQPVFNQLCEALRFSPSSFGLQPWKFILVKDPELRKKLRLHAWDQAQVTDADALIVLCSLKVMDEKYVRHFVETIARVRGVGQESLAGYEQMMLGSLKSKSPEMVSQWMKHQVYIALGVLLNECAHHRVDACPMEGFNSKEFDSLLDLPKQGLESVVLCALGYRAQDDHYAVLKKVRFDSKEIFINKP